MNEDVTYATTSPLLWVLGFWVVASVTCSAFLGKHLSAPSPKDVRYRDYAASVVVKGRPLIVGLFSPALVTVTSDTLTIWSNRFLSVALYFGLFSNDIVIPRSRIRSSRRTTWRMWGRPVAEVEYEGEFGVDTVRIAVHDIEKFLAMTANIDDGSSDDT